ncbi:hypothetical protein [Streptomyces albogriseolus]|uniref:hypothetical protein n=1 Tax=Streptomyces albogriseolus TaxID=1887 RepID=UPI00345FBAD4
MRPIQAIEEAVAHIRETSRALDVVGVGDAAHREALRLDIARLYGWPEHMTTGEHVDQWLKLQHCRIAWYQTAKPGVIVSYARNCEDGPVPSVPAPPLIGLVLYPAPAED